MKCRFNTIPNNTPPGIFVKTDKLILYNSHGQERDWWLQMVGWGGTVDEEKWGLVSQGHKVSFFAVMKGLYNDSSHGYTILQIYKSH